MILDAAGLTAAVFAVFLSDALVLTLSSDLPSFVVLPDHPVAPFPPPTHVQPWAGFHFGGRPEHTQDRQASFSVLRFSVLIADSVSSLG